MPSLGRVERMVSIIMPTYNYGRYLSTAVRSVVAQDYKNWELFIVDDGSMDDTGEVLAALIGELRDERIHVSRRSNGGVSSARNYGLDLARGEFVAFLDADDLWGPKKLSAQVAALAEFPEAGFSFCNFVRFDNNGERFADHFSFAPELFQLAAKRSRDQNAALVEGDAFSAMLQIAEMPWYPTANCARRDAIGDVRFDTSRKIGEDIDFFARIWLNSRAVAIFDVHCELRRHGSNASAVLHTPHQVNVIEILSHIAEDGANAHQLAAIRKRVGREWASLGYSRYVRGDVRGTASAYARALLKPGSRRTAALHLAALPVLWLRSGRGQPKAPSQSL